MIRVVLDTNILVSAILSPNGTPAQILRLEREGKIELVFSPDTIEEHWRVLSSDRIRNRLETRGVCFSTVEQFLKNIAKASLVVPGKTAVDVVKEDPTDNMFLACAIEGGADFIISGDQHLKNLQVFEKIPIVDPTTFMRKIHHQ